MHKYRVSWTECRIHYIDVVAGDEFEAIERAEEFEYGETASDESSYDNYTAALITDEA